MKASNRKAVPRFEWAQKMLENCFSQADRPLHVFDVGSGKQLMKSFVTQHGHKYSSFDMEPPNEEVRYWNIEEPFPYGDKADVILFLEVVEHLNNPWLGMKNLINCLNDNGVLILTTPNPSWSDSRMNMLRKGVLTMFTKTDLEVNHHVFTPWHFIVEKLLADAGFKNISFQNLATPTKLAESPFWGVQLPFRIIYRSIKIGIEKASPVSIGDTYGVIANK